MKTQRQKAAEIVSRVREGSEELTTQAFLEAAIQEFGGVENLMKVIKDDYELAPKGGMARQRTIGLLLSMVENYTKNRKATDEGGHLLTDDDLVREAEQILKRMEDRLTARPLAKLQLACKHKNWNFTDMRCTDCGATKIDIRTHRGEHAQET